MTNKSFKIGQSVLYTQCLSIYTGTVVKIKKSTLIVIDSAESMQLWNAGYSVGSEIFFNQVK
jgi:hypothetical protein